MCKTQPICLATRPQGWLLPYRVPTALLVQSSVSHWLCLRVCTQNPGNLLQHPFRHLLDDPSPLIILLFQAWGHTHVFIPVQEHRKEEGLSGPWAPPSEVLPFTAWPWLLGRNMCEENMAWWAVLFSSATSLHLTITRKYRTRIICCNYQPIFCRGKMER